jgi:hypothetical protein
MRRGTDELVAYLRPGCSVSRKRLTSGATATRRREDDDGRDKDHLKEAADEVSSAYSKAAKLSPGSSADLGRQQQGLKLLEEANATMSSLENASEQGSTGSVLGLRGELQARAKALSSLQQSLEAAQ